MQTNRLIFSDLLGAQARESVRRAFEPDGLRAQIASRAAGEPAEPGLTGQAALTASAGVVRARLQAVRDGFDRLAADLASDPRAGQAVRAKAALESTPLLMAVPYLLHRICGSWNNESRHAMAALRIHAADVGVGHAGASRAHRHAQLLRRHHPHDAGEDILQTGDDTRISDGAFNLAAALVVLGHFPESLAGEILGINLYLRQCGLLPSLALLADDGDDADTRRHLDLSRAPGGGDESLLALAETAVLEYLGHAPHADREAAVRHGHRWAREHVEAMSRAQLEVLTRWADPREAAGHLISRRRLDACLYHEKVRLNREPMQGLLGEHDAERFLAHLAASAYVRPGKPESSPLLTTLLGPRGKMFRIFSSDDVAILSRWIAGLPYADADANHGTAPREPAWRLWRDDGALAPLVRQHVAAPAPVRPIGARAAYARLLHEELRDDEEAFALRYATDWLARSARRAAGGHCTLPPAWAPGVLRRWLQAQHEASNRSLRHDDDIPSREGVVADILALAPLTMIDGAWLAGFAHPALASSGHGYRLFETFYDELGNGIESQNHPVIYRHLLKAVHGDMPPTADPGYAGAACFADRDFELPVFWLAIGRYPQTFCAEILGLNLAMELSGVGGGYRRTHRALIEYGYPTLFVDLHNSIDNISTGHTAWAAACLDAYLGGLPHGEREHQWARVRNGFVALNLPREHTMLDKLRKKMGALR